MKRMCDLHIHSNFSDGTYSPSELVEIAKQSNISAIALCDHNTVLGLNDFMQAAHATEIRAIPGIEISAEYNGKEVHILGLFINLIYCRVIENYLKTINRNKEKNNINLITALNDAGYKIDYADVKKIAGDAIPNRVHFARVLLRNGYVQTIDEAFDNILSPRIGLYHPPKRLDAFEVIAFLKSIKAMPVMAHPLLNLNYEELCEFLPQAKEKGLCGIETMYSLFDEQDTLMVKNLASRFGLLESGGSDFHGSNKPDIKMGVGKGNLRIPMWYYDDLHYYFLKEVLMI